MRKWILTPSWLRNKLRNCYDKYPNDLHNIDTRLINVTYMKFANVCVHSIKNYWWMSKWCVSFFAGYIMLNWIWILEDQGYRQTCAPLLKLEGACVPSFLGPRFESIQRCLTQAGPSVPPSQKLGGARVPSFRRSSLACYKFRESDIGRVTCAPPSQTMGGTRAPLPIPAFNHPFRDVSQAGPPVPPSQKLGGARVLSFRRSSLVEIPWH